jgi:hypothetical protein
MIVVVMFMMGRVVMGVMIRMMAMMCVVSAVMTSMMSATVVSPAVPAACKRALLGNGRERHRGTGRKCNHPFRFA